MAEHHRGREDHGRRVRLVGAHDVLADVSASGLEQGVFTTKVAAGHDAGAADEG
jgi:hypothetical protein